MRRMWQQASWGLLGIIGALLVAFAGTGWALSLYVSYPDLDAALADAASELATAASVPERLEPKLAVINLLERTQARRDEAGKLLERQLHAQLRQRLPQQVIALELLEQVRTNWGTTFPGSTRSPLAEDLAGEVNADWMVTGDYRLTNGLIQLRLQAYDFSTEEVVWQGLLEAPAPDLPDTVASAPDPTPDAPAEPAPDVAPPRSPSTTPEPPQIAATAPLPQPPVALPEPSLVAPTLEAPVALSDNTTADSSEEPAFLMSAPEPAPEPEGMVLLPGGTFLMGRANGNPDEFPDHRVQLSPFWLQQHEVTNAEFDRCPRCERGSGGFDSILPNAPVVYVDWENAARYCAFRGWRLPTEAEWEYAARAGGDWEVVPLPILQAQAWFASTMNPEGPFRAQPVGQLEANALGLFDLSGNVMEWVADYYAGDYYPAMTELENPTGPPEPVQPEYPARVVRGGAWGGLGGASSITGVQPTKRYAFAPWVRSFQIGFRCARDAS